jgi:hypothetical protein
LGLTFQAEQAALDEAVSQWQIQLDSPEDTPTQVRQKQAAYRKLQQQEDTQRTACDLWTAAFFTPLTVENITVGAIPTTATLQEYRRQPGAADPRVVGHARALAVRNQFFHWPLEFPHVFAAGGFIVMLGNPPWERIKLQEQEFFAARDPEIAAAANKAARQKMIDALPQTNPALHADFMAAKHDAEAISKFVRASGRFPLTAVGDVNTYALFAELSRTLLAPTGRAGIVVPTGIATDDTTKDFFSDLVRSQTLARLIGFENEARIFPDVHHAFKFCVLTITGQMKQVVSADFAFFCRYFGDIQQQQRHFQLTCADLALVSPNTGTCPIFRTRTDAELTKAIYHRVPVLVNELQAQNPWNIRFMAMFHMANDSSLFSSISGDRLVPLFEAKMIHQFDHRFSTYANATQANLNAGILPQASEKQKADSAFGVVPRYWIADNEVRKQFRGKWQKDWLLAYRRITSVVVEHTVIVSVIPLVGAADPAMVLLPSGALTQHVACLLANMNALVFDYAARQKLGGTDLRNHYFQQFPAVPPSGYTFDDIAFIAPRVLELVYTAWDIKAFADDLWRDAATDREDLGNLRGLIQQQWDANRAAAGGHPWAPPAWAAIAPDGCPLPPFKWDEARRALLRAELDAYYARLYGLTRDELRYILDPKDIYGPDFPGETFRVLKEKEEKAFGEYRTRRLVLEAWDRLAAELGPVVVRNYREEAEDLEGFGNLRGLGQVAETGATYQATVQPAAPAPPRFGIVQVPAAAAKSAPAAEPDLFSESNSGRMGGPPQGRPAPTRAASTQVDARPQARQPRFQSPDTPQPKPAAPPLVVPVMPAPQGAYPTRLAQVMALRKQTTPEAIGALIAALGDPDANIRWLAALTLQGIGSGTVIATLRAFIEQAPSALAREEAEKVLDRMHDPERRQAA